jgi:uncharacterized membrane protein YphA (DoxX/SURF4 family)
MPDWGRRDPGWVDAILDWRWTWLCARLALCSAYILGGFTKLANFSAAIAEQEHFGLHPGVAWATAAIVVELGGSSLIVAGRFAWLGAGSIGVLTAIAMLVANDFWNMTGAARFTALNAFFEHFGLIAGLVMAALIAEHDNRRHQPMMRMKLGDWKNE